MSAEPFRFAALPIRRTRRDVQVEPYFHAVEAGLEEVLLPRGIEVLRQLVESDEDEIAAYRRWTSSGLVVGVLLTDLHDADERLAALHRLGMPTVVMGEPLDAGDAAVVRTENREAMAMAVAALVEAGHRRIAHVTGPQHLLHTRARMGGFLDAAHAAGAVALQVEADYSAQGGVEAVEVLLAEQERPTAIVFDNDVMAVAAIGRLAEAALHVPRDVSLLAWDDSLPCRLAAPPLSAKSRDVYQAGVAAGRALVALLEGAGPTDTSLPAAVLVRRESLAAPAERAVKEPAA